MLLKFKDIFFDFLSKYKGFIFFILISVLAMIIRVQAFYFISGDMTKCLIPWYMQFKENGVNSLISVSNYNYLYRLLILGMSKLDFNCVYLYKILSTFFDFVLAFSFAYCVSLIKNSKKFDFVFNIAYATILFLPTIILNSSYWGQCDSIYVTFLMLVIFFLLKEKYFLVFLFYGLSLSFKLQAILILPFLIAYWLVKRKFTVFMFFLPFLCLWISGVFAYFNSADLLSAFKIYFAQTGRFSEMYINFPSFWCIAGNETSDIANFAKILTMIICLVGLFVIMSGKKKFETKEQILNTLCWFLWTCLIFLPSMHERYAYPLDILLLLLCFINPAYIKYAAMAELMSLVSYNFYLFGYYFHFYVFAVFYIIAYFHFTYTILCNDIIPKILDKSNRYKEKEQFVYNLFLLLCILITLILALLKFLGKPIL